MIRPGFFIDMLCEQGIGFFAGVPDSLLKNMCAYLTDHIPAQNNVIAANEGAAIGLATGYHLATGAIPVVYMQNSGIGNTVNPLLSLTDKEVYNVPVLLLIGWRGEPGVHDEPQHVKQGKVTLSLLDAMGIRHAVLSKDEAEFEVQLAKALDTIHSTNEAFAFVIQKDTFDDYKLKTVAASELTLSREEAIQAVTASLGERDVIVSTTGMISRELFEYRESAGEGHARDFLTVGSMGHASQIALGIALQQPNRTIWCFDGDGASIMHMGSMAVTGSMCPKNFIHVVFNNGAHDSVGGQPTVGLSIDLPQIARSSGYRTAMSVSNKEELLFVLGEIQARERPALLEIRVKKGARKDLGRPITTPVQNKESFMEFLKK